MHSGPHWVVIDRFKREYRLPCPLLDPYMYDVFVREVGEEHEMKIIKKFVQASWTWFRVDGNVIGLFVSALSVHLVDGWGAWEPIDFAILKIVKTEYHWDGDDKCRDPFVYMLSATMSDSSTPTPAHACAQVDCATRCGWGASRWRETQGNASREKEREGNHRR